MVSTQKPVDVRESDHPRRGTPGLPHVAAMTWRDGLFVHWPVDPAALRERIPPPLDLETYDGDAWVSVLPFVLANAGIRGSPQFTRLTVPELNVRTYVRFRGDPGLYFFSIDVDSALVGTVGRLTRLPVHDARMRVGKTDDRISFRSERTATSREPSQQRDDSSAETPARFAVTYESDGAAERVEPGSLEYWLTARRRFYAPSGRGIVTGEIAHEPWPLEPVTGTIHENSLFEANELPEPTGAPIASYCEKLSMTGSILRRVH